MNLGLADKVAIVTGGSRGIGKAIARRLAEEGANVVIAARSREVVEQAVDELRERTGGNVEGIVADVTDTAQVRNLMSRVNEKYGRLHILVNNAGKATGSHFEDISYEEWRSDFDLKVFGAIRCCREAIPYIKDSGGGSIINITASNAKTPGASSLPSSAARAAGFALTKALSKDLAQFRITVNTVCVGTIKTTNLDRDRRREAPHLTLEEYFVERGRELPLGRFGEPEEVGDLVAFLVSERARYITGTSVNIDGGTAGTI
jgi:3-oxoacyl-[acyl-carrier protein] reductase